MGEIKVNTKKILLVYSILYFIIVSCSTIKYYDSDQTAAAKWKLNELEMILNSEFNKDKKNNYYVLEFQNAVLQNRYYIFDDNEIKCYKECYENEKCFLIKSNTSISNYIEKLRVQILRKEKPELEGVVLSCDGCYCVVLYKFKKNIFGSIKFSNKELLAQHYIGSF